MKKLNLYLLLMFMHSFSYAQTGVNTRIPQAAFHVDGAKDNNTTGAPTATQELNDFIITNTGNVGIGTTTPQVKLDIVSGGTSANPISGLRIKDGTEGASKFLTSNEFGETSWKLFSVGQPLFGSFTWVPNAQIGNNSWNSIASLVIPPGFYTVQAKIHISVPSDATSISNGYVRFYVGNKNLGLNNNNAQDVPLLGGNDFFRPKAGQSFEFNQTFNYYNTSNTSETIYINIQSDFNQIIRNDSDITSPSIILGAETVENLLYAIPYFN